MRNKIILLSMLMGSMAPISAQQVSIGIGFPNVSIGINLPMYPDLVPVPGYPVYYAPGLNTNYFFYDGMYWVYQGDNWYASSWYNGPWGFVGPEFVPLFVLRIPVRYYRQPPMYFRGWQSDEPPRWGEHWGNDWAQRRSGWDRWNHSAVPARPPLPVYQRNYSGDRYPHQVEQQQALHNQNYRYQPRDPVVRQQYQAQRAQSAPAPAQRERPGVMQENNPRQQGNQRSNPFNPPRQVQQSAPSAPQTQAPQPRGPFQQQSQRPEQRAVPQQRPEPKAAPQQRPEQRDVQRQQQPEQRNVQRQQPAPQPRSQETKPQGNAAQQEPKRGQRSDQEKDRGNANDGGQDRGR